MKKIKVYCKDEHRISYEQMLTAGGFTVSEEATLTFIEENYVPQYLIGKASDESVLLNLQDIIIIETYGKDIVARQPHQAYKIKDTLEHLEQLLKPAGFFRISQSAIIHKDSIEKIRSGLSMRFHLTLKAGIKADVTRSYYYAFKKIIGL